MNSTFMGLEIGKKGLMSHQQALHVTGHNISNAENKEYSRQRVVITAADPLYVPSLNRAKPPGNIGQGSVVQSVERIRDSFIDDRIMVEKNNAGYWKVRNEFIYQIETVYNEPIDQSLRTRLDELWKSWEELSKYPEERSTREVVREKAINLTNEVNYTYNQLYELRLNANRQIEHRVDQINMYAQGHPRPERADSKGRGAGRQPQRPEGPAGRPHRKDVGDRDISVGRSDKDETIVYIGGENLVQGEIIQPLAGGDGPGQRRALQDRVEGHRQGRHGEGRRARQPHRHHVTRSSARTSMTSMPSP